MRPVKVNEFQLEGAISYNSMIEVEDFLPKKDAYKDSAIIACALKSQKVHLIMITPDAQPLASRGTGNFQILKTLNTEIKPTCLIQLSKRHLAIAVGSLKQKSNIEIHDINAEVIVAVLREHTDMIDSLLKFEFSPKMFRTKSNHVQWILSASRDRRIILWKLIDGKIMSKCDYPPVELLDKPQKISK